MSQIIVGPNDVYFVEVADIRNMAEKNGVKKAVEMLDKTGATFVKFIFEETTNGFKKDSPPLSNSCSPAASAKLKS